MLSLLYMNADGELYAPISIGTVIFIIIVILIIRWLDGDNPNSIFKSED